VSASSTNRACTTLLIVFAVLSLPMLACELLLLDESMLLPLINATVVTCALIALGSTVRVALRGVRPGVPGFNALVLLALVTLLAGEIATWAREIMDLGDEIGLGPVNLLWIAGRVLVLALFAQTLRAPRSGPAQARGRAVLLALVGSLVLGFGLFGVALPMAEAHGGLDQALGPVLVIVLQALVLALVPVVYALGGLGSARDHPQRRFTLLGLALYMATDQLLYHLSVIGREDIWVPELGYLAGYLLVAYGMLAADREPAA